MPIRITQPKFPETNWQVEDLNVAFDEPQNRLDVENSNGAKASFDGIKNLFYSGSCRRIALDLEKRGLLNEVDEFTNLLQVHVHEILEYWKEIRELERLLQRKPSGKQELLNQPPSVVLTQNTAYTWDSLTKELLHNTNDFSNLVSTEYRNRVFDDFGKPELKFSHSAARMRGLRISAFIVFLMKEGGYTQLAEKIWELTDVETTTILKYPMGYVRVLEKKGYIMPTREMTPNKKISSLDRWKLR